MVNNPMPLFAIILGAVLLQVANGLLGVIIPLQLGLAKASSTEIGIAVTAYSIGFLAGCLKSPGLIREIGHIRAFAVLAAIFSVSSLLFIVLKWPMAWAVMRLVGGFAAAGLYAVIESWVTDQAPVSGRGRLLAIYMVCNKAGLMFGQGLLTFVDSEASGFFLLAGVCTVIAIIPVSITRTGGPPTRDVATLSFLQLYRIAPMGIVGCIGAGMVNPTMLGLAPVYGLKIGISAQDIPLLIVAAQFGTFVLQWPLGWLSDRIDRRWIIVLATGGSSVVGLILAVIGNADLFLLLLLFGIWGGFALSVYSVCIAHAGDYVDQNQLVPLVSSLMMAWAIGASVGPPLATIFLNQFDAIGLMYYTVVVSASIGAFALWRMIHRGPVAPENRDAFVNIPASSTIVADLVADVERDSADHKND